jgi:hypothetical protein
MDDDLANSLGRVFGTRNASARSTAALLSNPGCERRALLDAGRVDLVTLAERLGAPAQFGQSPFAIGQGNRFEERIKADGYASLVTAINDVLGIFEGVSDLRSVNLERVGGLRGRALVKARAARTADVLEAIANAQPDAPHVVDHGVTTLEVGGNTVYLEQDALAFRVGEHLRICEVKGFPIIDGSASPTKVGAAARQTAVYVASIQDTLEARGFDPKLVSSEVVLVCPKNFSIVPTAVLVDVDREVRALRRQLRRRSGVSSIAVRVGAEARSRGVDLQALLAEVEAAKVGTKADQEASHKIIDHLPFHYVPECLAGCDLARHCRSCSRTADQVGRLGGEVSSLLGSVDTVAEAIDLIDGAEPSADQAEVSIILRATSQAIDDVLGPA